ncbi:MAG: DUF3800 domain-containing protein [Candidatus Heimdallarchaeaceae archaeon]
MNYIFVDESGDPGKPFKKVKGKNIPTGASLFYIVVALPVTSEELFLIEQQVIKIKFKYGFKKEIKSTLIPLPMYRDLLRILKKLNIKAYYRSVNKKNYKGTFAVDGNRKLHNVFDEYNLVKTVYYAVKGKEIIDADVIIDRADRRLLDGKFENFDKYLLKRLNTKTIRRVKFVTHADSEYVFLTQMSDLVCGVIKNKVVGKNKELGDILGRNLLRKVW